MLDPDPPNEVLLVHASVRCNCHLIGSLILVNRVTDFGNDGCFDQGFFLIELYSVEIILFYHGAVY